MTEPAQRVEPDGKSRRHHLFRILAVVASMLTILSVYSQSKPIDSAQFIKIMLLDGCSVAVMYSVIRMRFTTFGLRIPNAWDVCAMLLMPFVGGDIHQRFLFGAGWLTTLSFVVGIFMVLRLFGVALDKEMDALNSSPQN